ncbi:MAG: hypothetical protein AB8F74_12830 [Saprospiraceae bacterium]
MELFLLVSMVLTIVTFSLVVLSEPATPAMVEDHDSVLDSSANERISEVNEPTISQPAIAM